MIKRPGGALASRPLHFIWIVDCSRSMRFDGKIQALNQAAREAIPHMQRAAEENPNAQVLVRVLRFATGAQWHVAEPVPIEQFRWTDLEADGVTDMGAAFNMVADQLTMPPMSERALPPVLVLISDGQATDDWEPALKRLLDEQWGRRAVRVAIAIGDDADRDILKRFMGDQDSALKPLDADNPESVVRLIKWASTVPLKAASNAKPFGVIRLEGPSSAQPVPEAPVAVRADTHGDLEIW